MDCDQFAIGCICCASPRERLVKQLAVAEGRSRFCWSNRNISDLKWPNRATTNDWHIEFPGEEVWIPARQCNAVEGPTRGLHPPPMPALVTRLRPISDGYEYLDQDMIA